MDGALITVAQKNDQAGFLVKPLGHDDFTSQLFKIYTKLNFWNIGGKKKDE